MGSGAGGPFPPPGSSSLGFTSSPSPFSSSSPENVEDSGLDSPSHAAAGPSPDSWVPRPGTPQSPPTCRVSPPESRGTQSLLPSDSPQPLAASPGPWGPEAVAGGGESLYPWPESFLSPGGCGSSQCVQGLNRVLRETAGMQAGRNPNLRRGIYEMDV